MSPRRRLLALAAIVSVAFAAVALGAPHSPAELRAVVDGIGPLAPVAFAVCWIVTTPALASGTLLAVASGLAFGVALGTVVGIAGATLGGIAAFSLARRYGHAAALEVSGPCLRRVHAGLERRGFRAVLVARLAPGVPTTVLNYACGLSRVRLRDFAAATLVGGAPRIVAYTSIGASGGRLDATPALVGFGVLAAIYVGAGSLALLRRRRSLVAQV